jgi:UDP-glucose 4-epimerase
MGANNPVEIIGTRHGEKLFETLLTREELSVAQDLGGYYRVPADQRDLNYGLYFDQGRQGVSLLEDYNSHNTIQLSLEALCELLDSLDCVRQATAWQLVQT